MSWRQHGTNYTEAWQRSCLWGQEEAWQEVGGSLASRKHELTLHLPFFSCICTLIYKDHDTMGTGGPSMREAGVDEEKEQKDLYASTSSFLDIK